MKIWLINNYNMLPEHGALNRNYYLAKYLKRLGHDPVVFVGSHPHNTRLQLISDKNKYLQYQNCEFPWILIKTCNYEGSKIKRIYSMVEFYINLIKAVKHFDTPDAIIGSSPHPLAAIAAIKISKKLGCKGIIEIRDLWPESLIAYGVLKKESLLAKCLYQFEKKIYRRANGIIFSMEGGRDYIKEKGWDQANNGPVDLSKVFHINNGVDLELYNFNRNHFCLKKDDDLENSFTFKVIYMGSIRQVNNLSLIIDTAYELKKREANHIKILIYGEGNERESLEKKVTELGLENITFKGHIEKKYVPYVLSKGNLNLLHWTYTSIMRFGASPNKLFDYFASGKPILSDLNLEYDLIKKYGAGIVLKSQSPKEIANAIIDVADTSTTSTTNYSKMCRGAENAAHEYDFKVLSKKLANVIDSCKLYNM